jgi:hypothetical protein
MRVLVALSLPVFAVACHDDAVRPPTAGQATSASAKIPASAFGRPIVAGPALSLVDIAKSPAQYKGMVVTT